VKTGLSVANDWKSLAKALFLFGLLAAACESGAANATSGSGLQASLTQLHHTAWRVRDGEIASEIYGVTQTRDGYLWAASDAGLLRFDGVRFTPMPAAGQTEAGVVYAARGGGLWVGFAHEAVRVEGDRIARYSHASAGRFSRFAEDSSGVLWASEQNSSAGKGLRHIKNGDLRRLGPPTGFPAPPQAT
jgi:ligand-binding sensor domain-containing protein